MKNIATACSLLLLSACSSVGKTPTPIMQKSLARPASVNTITPQPVQLAQSPAVHNVYYDEMMWQAPAHHHTNNHQLLTNYINRLAKELLQNMPQYYYTSPIAVTSFVNLDSNLQTTNLAGNQIAEELVTEIRQLGLSVIDYKLTGIIKVTANGDFVFSRDAQQLRSQLGINNVLTGTMIWHENGLVLNTRIVNLESNAVLAAAKGYIPYFVADQVFSGPVSSKFKGYSAH